MSLTAVREVQLLGHEEAALGLSCDPDFVIASTAQLLVEHGVHVIAQSYRAHVVALSRHPDRDRHEMFVVHL